MPPNQSIVRSQRKRQKQTHIPEADVPCREGLHGKGSTAVRSPAYHQHMDGQMRHLQTAQ